MRVIKDESGSILRISGALEISVADELRSALQDYILTASRPVIDLSGVEECDTAGVQLLCSARRTADQAAKPFELAGVPAAVRVASVALGLTLGS